MSPRVCISVGMLLFGTSLHACIWDADTLVQERLRSSDMASVILHDPPAPPDPAPLRKRIENLTAAPRRDDPSWWNDLAGAHLRLGEAKEAVALLETVTNRFPGDYGVHANLGTAYHLLGRYADAEREIARDLEINPDAHFGLERYHLALLQYLVRGAEYREQHVYIDEWSAVFFGGTGFLRFRSAAGKLDATETNEEDFFRLEIAKEHWSGNTNDWQAREISQLEVSATNPPPSYRFKWDLAADPKFKDGVIYMATMNPKEPACFVMLGIACVKSRDYNLAVAAYDRAIKLGSPQTPFLREQVESLNHYIWESQKTEWPMYGILSLFPLVIAIYVVAKIRDFRRKRRSYNGSRPA